MIRDCLVSLVVLAIAALPVSQTARSEPAYAAAEKFIVGTWTHRAPGNVIMLRLRFGRDKSYEIALLDPATGRPDKSAPETGTWEMLEPNRLRIDGWRGRVTDVAFRILDANTMLYDGQRYRRMP